MPSIKEFRLRIRSLQNTRKITSAMKLVASSKLKRAQGARLKSATWIRRVDGLCGRLLSAPGVSHPLAAVRPERRVRVVVLSSDRGLCGNFNHRVLREAQAVCEAKAAAGAELEIVAVGRRALAFFRKGPWADRTVAGPDLAKAKVNAVAGELRRAAVADFASGRIDALYLVGNECESALVQRPVSRRLLPTDLGPDAPAGGADGTAKGAEARTEYVMEPSPARLLDAMLPLRLHAQLLRALFESLVGEHGARMAAMDSATRNSGDLIDRLTLMANRARQSAITTELTEIVSGAEALKG